MTLMTFAAVFQLYRWRRNPSKGQTALLGFVLGGLLLAKASGVPLFALAIAFMLILKPEGFALHPQEWNWRQASVALLISFFVVWGIYRFHVSTIRLAATNFHPTVVSISIPNRPEPIVYQPSRRANLSIPFPAYEYIQGLGFRLKDDKDGHPAFLLGRSYVGGSKAYFPVAIALKCDPLVVLLLAVSSAVLLALRRMALPHDFFLWAVFPVVYFSLAEFASVNIGERHILPVYPFVLLLCGSLWALTKRHRAIWMLLLLAVAVNAADTLRYAPDYLSYFTPFVRPAESFKLLSDSNVDWGQGLIALRDYEREHPNETIHLAYSGTVDPALYGVHGIPLMPNDTFRGQLSLARIISRQALDDPNGYHWVLQYPRKTILNHSLYVFEVPAPNRATYAPNGHLVMALGVANGD